MTLLEAISPTARELLTLHCTPPRRHHLFMLGICSHCGAKKRVVDAARKAAHNTARKNSRPLAKFA